mmetsp:Transcript_103990/g.299340  ORF Transcript_103990/g.299340 Transcript_103990/m.299340 type:complete len:204 (-) Transcript_103990:339-950(-)
MDVLLHAPRVAHGRRRPRAAGGAGSEARARAAQGIAPPQGPFGGGYPGCQGWLEEVGGRRGGSVQSGRGGTIPEAEGRQGQAGAPLLHARRGGQAQGPGRRRAGYGAVHDLAQQGLRLKAAFGLAPGRRRVVAVERGHGRDEGLRALRALGEGARAARAGHARRLHRPRGGLGLDRGRGCVRRRRGHGRRGEGALRHDVVLAI